MKASIVLLPGDGVGPEVTAVVQSALECTAESFGHQFSFRQEWIGGAAIDDSGSPLPQATLDAVRQADAVFLGAVGGPRWDHLRGEQRCESGLLKLRSALGVYANIRPVKPHEALLDRSPIRADRLQNVDLMVVRELTSGIYFGRRERGDDYAIDECRYTRDEVRRIVHRAAQLARSRRGHLTLVDKANVLETSRLWRETAQEMMAAEYPDITFDIVLVDAAAMHLISQPSRFDVIVTENLFGDILTDEASVLAASLGMLGSASLGDGGPGLFEPIHGSAPDIAGKGIANPIGGLMSAAMLLRDGLQLPTEADKLEAAINEVVSSGVVTSDVGGSARTIDVGDAVCDALSQRARAA